MLVKGMANIGIRQNCPRQQLQIWRQLANSFEVSEAQKRPLPKQSWKIAHVTSCKAAKDCCPYPRQKLGFMMHAAAAAPIAGKF
jgi:hypothetical protein